ncbi:MAG: NAD(P)/FAD-dependent oxidoreductase [Phycisphaeraceae bacterium]|nr:NAD(P)/FAD-dependent oxidoreductase [Phycisphaeraceae bacterium]
MILDQSARIVIIGAGPAGCSAAIALASAGWRVTIFERAVFPRTKPCGEFISPAATRLLERLIPRPRLIAIGGAPARSMLLERGSGTLRAPLRSSAWAVPRSALDHELLRRAREAGAHVVQPSAVLGVGYSAHRALVRVADGREVSCGLVVHADGTGRHDPRGPVAMAPGWIGIKCHVRRMFEGVRIRACRGAYVGTIGFGGNRGTIAIAVRSAWLGAHRGDLDALARTLWPEFDPRWREGEWTSCGIARSRYVGSGHPRSIRIGNAAAAVDPIGGEGIGLALWSGDFLGRLIVESCAIDDCSPDTWQQRFAREFRRRLRLRSPACRMAAEVLVRPMATRAFWSMVGARTALVRAWSSASGKAGPRPTN